MSRRSDSKQEEYQSINQSIKEEDGTIDKELEDLNLEKHHDPKVQQMVEELTKSQGANEESDGDMDGSKSAQSKSKKDGDDDDDDDSDDSSENCVIKTNDMIWQPESNLNNWLKKVGKDHYINFKEDEKALLKTYFNSLDSDGGGSIGIDELEDPLIALGLVDNRQQVQNIMTSVDDDGEIEFPEFLNIIKGGSKGNEGAKDDGTSAIYLFFKDLTSGKMSIDGNEHIPFPLFISSQRRRKILQAIMPDPKAPYLQKDGERILTNYKKQKAEALVRDWMEEHPHETSGKNSKGFDQTAMSLKSQKSLKQKKKQDAEDRQQKLVQSKLHEISHFDGDPPEESQLLDILKRKKKF